MHELHTVAGEIVCDNGGSASCTPANFSESDAECGEARCATASQHVGSSELRPVSSTGCKIPVGICNPIVSCAVP